MLYVFFCFGMVLLRITITMSNFQVLYGRLIRKSVSVSWLSLCKWQLWHFSLVSRWLFRKHKLVMFSSTYPTWWRHLILSIWFQWTKPNGDFGMPQHPLLRSQVGTQLKWSTLDIARFNYQNSTKILNGLKRLVVTLMSMH